MDALTELTEECDKRRTAAHGARDVTSSTISVARRVRLRTEPLVRTGSRSSAEGRHRSFEGEGGSQPRVLAPDALRGAERFRERSTLEQPLP